MEKRTLTCILTPTELTARGAELARATSDWSSCQEEKKNVTKTLNDSIKDHEANMKRLSRVVKFGREEREVEVEWLPYPMNERMRLFRKDTGEEIDSRMMTKEEREAFKQPPLPLPKTPIAPPPPVTVFGLPPAAMPIAPEPPAPDPLGLPPANYIAPVAPVATLQLENKEIIQEAEFEVVATAPVVPSEERGNDEQNQQ